MKKQYLLYRQNIVTLIIKNQNSPYFMLLSIIILLFKSLLHTIFHKDSMLMVLHRVWIQ